MIWPLRPDFLIDFGAIFRLFRPACSRLRRHGKALIDHPVFADEVPVGGMETFLTRAITIVALTCFLVVGAAATAFSAATACPLRGTSWLPHPPPTGPVSNKESKQDRLAVAALALAAFEPQQADRPAERAAASGLCLDRAGRYRHAESRPHPQPAARSCAAKPKAADQAAAAKELRAAERHPDRRHQGAPETFRPRRNPTGRRSRPRCARSPARFTRSGRPIPTRPACRSIPRPKKSSS